MQLTPEIGVMIQQKVRKKKKTCFSAYAGGKRNLTVQCIVSKQIRCGH